jgi:spore germination protein YaaH
MSKRLNMSGSAYTVDIKSATYTVSIASLTKEEKENVLFVQVMNQAANVAIDSVLEQDPGVATLTSGVKTIAPTWFRLLDNDGNIENISDKAYVDKINAYGIDVWGVWTDVDYSVDLGAILRNTSKRNKLVDSIVSDAKAAGLQGVNIDFETLKSDYGQDFVQFIRELSVKTHDAGLILSVDNYVPAAYNSFYGIDQQGVFADYVIIMGYDEHYAGSAEAGSVASIDYVEQGIIQATNVMPANKVINAIPFYTRAWTTAAGEVSSKALGMAEAKEWANANGIALEWDNETCQQYGQIEKGGTLYQIWLEDAESIQVKLSVMQSYNVGGVAEWKAGLESNDVWLYIDNFCYE